MPVQRLYSFSKHVVPLEYPDMTWQLTGLLGSVWLCLGCVTPLSAQDQLWQVGVAKVDITPATPSG